LFRQFQQAGYRVALFSEAASIFTGIDLGSPCVQLSTRPSEGLAQLRDWLAEPDPSPRCLFVHSWRAHTPYAAADGLALGETAQLLRHGGETIVRERYRVAVQGVFEEQLAPLISGLDLGAWVVVIFGDHGESWTKDELYHGKTLRNSVLRVPLWIHVPYAARSLADEGVVSLVDLFPTLCSLFALPGSAEPLLGIDLLRGPGSEHRRAVAQIRPGLDDDGIVLAPPAPKVAEVRWSIFDGDLKLLGEADDWELVETWSERRLPSPIDSELAGPHRLAWRTLQEESPWTSRALEEGSAVDEPLRERLRALGYLP
jgi:hypothetical protein